MRIIRSLMLTTLVAATIALIGCSGSSTQPGPTAVQDVSGPELEALLDGSTPPTMLDVRSATEYDDGHIPGSINIPLDELADRLDELAPADAVACVCSAGFRSAQAAQILLNAGFRTVYTLEDGLRSWDGPWTGGCPTC